MNTATVPPPAPGYLGTASLRKWTVGEYHRMIDSGVLTGEDKVELLEGYVVLKMPRNPPHDGTMDLLDAFLPGLIPPGWFVRTQRAVTFSDSQPEPDYAVVRGDRRHYLGRHPGPADIGLVVEISSSSLARDRDDKARVYAREGIPVYWVVNLIDRQVEVYTQPSGSTAAPAYARVDRYSLGDSAPVVIDGQTVGTIAVADVLP